MKKLRLGLWVVTLGFVTAALFHPTWVLLQPVYRYLMVVDITQSMHARDYHLLGLPSERLAFAKAALEQAILNLPCGSQIGLGIFTHKDTELLLEPLEVCQHAPSLRTALRNIDWRSAWAADSFIAYGLFDALRAAEGLQADLVFLTDGDQFPKTPSDPGFFGRPARGWLVGVGGMRPVPIPKLDFEGRLLGYWQITDLSRDRDLLPRRAELLLSRLDETHLRQLANITGLEYFQLMTPQQLVQNLRRPDLAKTLPTEVDLRPWLGALAFFAALAAMLI
ncbi:MAG: VWA domain-containing protein [Methylohalobius sp.]|nr:VWA domain-containing protein [Methylohalobius sp.]